MKTKLWWMVLAVGLVSVGCGEGANTPADAEPEAAAAHEMCQALMNLQACKNAEGCQAVMAPDPCAAEGGCPPYFAGCIANGVSCTQLRGQVCGVIG